MYTCSLVSPPASLHIPYWQEFFSVTKFIVCPKLIVARYGQKGLSGFVSCTLLLQPNRRLECDQEKTALRSVPAQRMGLGMLRWYLTLGDVKDPRKDHYNTVSGEGTRTNWWACEAVIHFKAMIDLFDALVPVAYGILNTPSLIFLSLLFLPLTSPYTVFWKTSITHIYIF